MSVDTSITSPVNDNRGLTADELHEAHQLRAQIAALMNDPNVPAADKQSLGMILAVADRALGGSRSALETIRLYGRKLANDAAHDGAEAEAEDVASDMQSSKESSAAEQAQIQKHRDYYGQMNIPYWNNYSPAAQNMMIRQDMGYARSSPEARLYQDVQQIVTPQERTEAQAGARQARRDLEALAAQHPEDRELQSVIQRIQESNSGVVPPSVARAMRENRTNIEGMREALRTEAEAGEQRRATIVDRSRATMRDDQERGDVDAFAQRSGRTAGGRVTDADRERFNSLVERATVNGRVDPGRLSEEERQEMRFHNFNVNVERRVINENMGAWASRYLARHSEQELTQLMQREPAEITRMMTDAGLIRRNDENARNLIESQLAPLNPEQRAQFFRTHANRELTEQQRNAELGRIYQQATGLTGEQMAGINMTAVNAAAVSGNLSERSEVDAYVNSVKERYTPQNAEKSPATVTAAEPGVQTAAAGTTKPQALDPDSHMGQALASAVERGANNPSISGGQQVDRAEPVAVTAGIPAPTREQAPARAVG